MNYINFSVKSVISISNNENMTFGFSLFGTTFFSSILLIFRAKFCPKGLNVVYLSEITATTLTFQDRNADVTYCADVTFFLRAMSGGLSLTVAFFLRRFIALNAIWAHFLGAELYFHPYYTP